MTTDVRPIVGYVVYVLFFSLFLKQHLSIWSPSVLEVGAIMGKLVKTPGVFSLVAVGSGCVPARAPLCVGMATRMLQHVQCRWKPSTREIERRDR